MWWHHAWWFLALTSLLVAARTPSADNADSQLTPVSLPAPPFSQPVPVVASPIPTAPAVIIPTRQPAENLVVDNSGLSGTGVTASYIYAALIIENNNPRLAAEGVRHSITTYNSDGAVLRVSTGRTEIVLPQEQLGVVDGIGVPQGQEIARWEVQLLT
jgi:hypothetical protein